MIILREALLRYDHSEDPKEKEAALNKIKDYCYWTHDYTKPSNLKKIKKTTEQVKGAAAADNDTSEEEDEELRRFETRFDQSTEFAKTTLVDSLMSSNQAANIHPRYYPTMDYSKMTHQYQYQSFIQNHQIQHIDFNNNKSFESKLKELLKEKNFEHFYQCSFLTQKYGIEDLLRLRKTFSQFDNFEIVREITYRKFYREFYEGAYQSYSYE